MILAVRRNSFARPRYREYKSRKYAGARRRDKVLRERNIAFSVRRRSKQRRRRRARNWSCSSCGSSCRSKRGEKRNSGRACSSRGQLPRLPDQYHLRHCPPLVSTSRRKYCKYVLPLLDLHYWRYTARTVIRRPVRSLAHALEYWLAWIYNKIAIFFAR